MVNKEGLFVLPTESRLPAKAITTNRSLFGFLLTSHTQAGAPMARHAVSRISNSLPVSQTVACVITPLCTQQMGESAVFPGC